MYICIYVYMYIYICVCVCKIFFPTMDLETFPFSLVSLGGGRAIPPTHIYRITQHTTQHCTHTSD